MNIVKDTIKYVKEEFDKCEYYKTRKEEMEYRLNHTYRVARYGKIIAQEEGLDQEALVIGCLLHDIGYVYDYETSEEHRNHGRVGAEHAKEYITSLPIADSLKSQILYGIATHVDGKSDFLGTETVLSESISDCDNIDRFDVYRIYDSLQHNNFMSLPLLKQIDFCEKMLERLERAKKHEMSTETANKLFIEKVNYQENFYRNLYSQLEKSDYNLLY